MNIVLEYVTIIMATTITFGSIAALAFFYMHKRNRQSITIMENKLMFNYGADELKKYYQKFLLIGLEYAVVAHIIIVVAIFVGIKAVTGFIG